MGRVAEEAEMSVLPKDEDFPEGSCEAIAAALPIAPNPMSTYRDYEKYDLAKRLVDAASIVGELRRAGFKLVKK